MYEGPEVRRRLECSDHSGCSVENELERSTRGNRDIRRLSQSVREEMRLARTKVTMTNGENWID